MKEKMWYSSCCVSPEQRASSGSQKPYGVVEPPESSGTSCPGLVITAVPALALALALATVDPKRDSVRPTTTEIGKPIQALRMCPPDHVLYDTAEGAT
jgi:hypothetical protein